MAELVDALDLESSVLVACRFDPCYPHQVVCRYEPLKTEYVIFHLFSGCGLALNPHIWESGAGGEARQTVNLFSNGWTGSNPVAPTIKI